MNYLDTSALIKRFVVETGSDLVQLIVTGQGPIATAKIAYAEVYAGLNRKRREGALSGPGYKLAAQQFEGDWQAYVRVDLRDEILSLARGLIERHPLRGFDAVHLASALSLKSSLGEEITFAAADGGLLQAAAAENLRALNVEKARD